MQTQVTKNNTPIKAGQNDITQVQKKENVNPFKAAFNNTFKPKTNPWTVALQKAGIQPKLAIGKANDPYEQEADRIADQVVSMPEPNTVQTKCASPVQKKAAPQTIASQITPLGANFAQKKCAACEAEEKLQGKFIQMKGEGDSASSQLESQINSSKGGGSPMDNNTQSFMNERFGTDFSGVRIHTGGPSVQMNQELGAKAFTVGNDIHFNQGEYNPGSQEGKKLLAHELTHTVQQGGIQSVSPQLQTSTHVIQKENEGSLITSRGEEAIEGMTVTGDSDINGRLQAGEEAINNQIDEWARENFNHVASSLESAAESFENWYSMNANPSSSSFVLDVVSAGLGILGAAYPPAGLAAAIIGGVLSVGRSAVQAQENARRGDESNAAVIVEQAMINKAVALRQESNRFGSRLKTEGENVWNSIGIAITMNEPDMIPIAKYELYQGASLPSLDQNFTETALTDMILSYEHWERVTSLENSTLFVSSDDLTWAFWNQRQRRRWASRQARSQLGITEDDM